MLNAPQVDALLAVCAGYDNRKPGDLNARAWQKASDLGHWSLDEAIDAVDEHYAHTIEFVKPAQVQAIIRKHRTHAEAIEQADNRRAITGPSRSWSELWDGIETKSATRRDARRRAVLAHPDLAARLTAPPIGYRQPDQWNGGIPPLVDVEGRDCGSPRAHALHALADEARARLGRPDPSASDTHQEHQ